MSAPLAGIAAIGRQTYPSHSKSSRLAGTRRRRVFSIAKYRSWDFYGFAAPYENSLPLQAAEYLRRPLDDFKGGDRMGINDRNIAAFTRFYRGESVEPPPGSGIAAGKPTKASRFGGRVTGPMRRSMTTKPPVGRRTESRNGWIEVDLGQDRVVGRAVVMELAYARTQKFAIEYKEGDVWKAVLADATIAGRRTFDFAPVKARHFRLNILEANEVPTIEEFQLYAPGARLK